MRWGGMSGRDGDGGRSDEARRVRAGPGKSDETG
jgi:hypothetical protein